MEPRLLYELLFTELHHESLDELFNNDVDNIVSIIRSSTHHKTDNLALLRQQNT